MADPKEIPADPVETPEVVVEDAPRRVVSADEGIDSLKQQLDAAKAEHQAEKTRREAAERQAHEAATQVHRAKAEVDDTNLQLITNAIETVKGQTGSLRTAYADAMAKGDYTKAADIQMEMSSNAAKLLQLETGRQAMAERPKTQAPAADPVEALASQLTPRSAAWLRAHSEYATDKRLYRKMVRAHEDAIDDGMKADSEEYFSAVESRLGLNKHETDPDDDDGTDLAAKPVSRRSSPAAAPVSRSGSPSSSTRPGAIRLSAAEREMARLTKQTDEEYWNEKQKISRDQRYN